MAGLTLGGGLGILGRSHRPTGCSPPGSSWPTAALWTATSTITRTCSGRCGALVPAPGGDLADVRRRPRAGGDHRHLTWPPARARLIQAWQGWAPLQLDELAASLKLSVGGELDQPASVDVYGRAAGTEADASELLDGLVVRAGADPALAWVKKLSFADTRRFWADLPVGEAGAGHGPHSPSAQYPYLAAKSEFFKRPRPPRPWPRW